MGRGFLKFRKRFLISALIKGAITGIFAAGLSVSLLLLADKLDFISAELWLYIVSAVSVAAVTFGAVFFFLYPRDRKIAKRIDDDLGLHEKVQTMVAFSASDDPMSVLQREDTEARLSVASVKQIRERRIWAFLIVPVIAVAMLSVAIITPAKEPEEIGGGEEVEDPVFELDNWQRTALLNLIESVKKSKMQDEPKALTVEQLENLLLALEDAAFESEMKENVIGVISEIRSITAKANSYSEISAALRESEETKALGEAMLSFSATVVKAELDALAAGFNEKNVKENATLLTTYFNLALSKIPVSDVPETDELRIAVKNLSAALSAAAEKIETYSPAAVLKDISAAFAAANDAINTALLAQADNKQVCASTVQSLMRIFGISESELPKDPNDDSSTENGGSSTEGTKPPDKGEQTGGYSEPETVYAEDDHVWWPEGNEHSAYGPLLRDEDDYLYKADEKTELVDDELALLIMEYFNKLSNALDTEND